MAVAVLLVWVGRRQTDEQARRLGRILGGLTALIYAAVLVYSFIPPSVKGSVPLQLTDVAATAGAYALWAQRHWAVALTYYWGLGLSVQALISPVLRVRTSRITGSSRSGPSICWSSGPRFI